MRNIGLKWKDLEDGYASIARAQRLLELEWTRAIKVAERRIHQRKLQAWSAKVASELRRQRLLKILTPIVFVLLCSCAVISTLLPWSLLSWGAAIFVSFIMLVVLLGQTAVVERLEKNPPPKTAEGRKLLNITEKWWQGLQPPPLQIQVDGDTGEKSLLESLEKRLSNRYIALHQFLVLRNLDADVLVLGPSGIWLLESKYHSGRVICRNGEWFHEKSYYGKGGIPKKETQPWKPYDEQWLREKGAIIQTIQHRLPPELHWLASEIRGGLAFTHKKITLEIDSSCQVEYGDTPYWVNKIGAAPAVPQITTEVLLCLVDALADYADEISEEASGKSAVLLAGDLYSRAEGEIPLFVKANL